MRTTKVIAFSVPPDFEREIQRHAKNEHRTVSEYIREALRQYIALKDFDAVQKNVARRAKKKGLKSSDVARTIEILRR